MPSAGSWIALVLGHLLSVALVAAAALRGLPLDRELVQALACALLMAAAAVPLCKRAPAAARARAAHAGLAVWSFVVATAHGAGLLLVPALMPLCGIGDAGAPLLAQLGAVVLHMAVMMAASGGIAFAAGRGLSALRRGVRSRERS
jgi:hypothetical protein